MRRMLSVAGALTVLTVIAAALSSAPAQASPLVQVDAVNGQVVPGEYIVTLQPGASGDAAQRAGIAAMHTYRHAITGFAAKLTDRQLRTLQRDRDVLAIEP